MNFLCSCWFFRQVCNWSFRLNTAFTYSVYIFIHHFHIHAIRINNNKAHCPFGLRGWGSRLAWAVCLLLSSREWRRQDLAWGGHGTDTWILDNELVLILAFLQHKLQSRNEYYTTFVMKFQWICKLEGGGHVPTCPMPGDATGRDACLPGTQFVFVTMDPTSLWIFIPCNLSLYVGSE